MGIDTSLYRRFAEMRNFYGAIPTEADYEPHFIAREYHQENLPASPE
jgi:hypothetical protein